MYKYIILVACLSWSCTGMAQKEGKQNKEMEKKSNTTQVVKTDAEWKAQLTPMQYHVAREAGTERPFTGIYWNHKEKGVYKCIGCGEVLFTSEQKFDSSCGWPSFFDAIDKNKITYRRDTSFGMVREEILCKKCGSHLGHIFDDGPAPTGQRYCVNSASLDFEKN